MTRTEISDRVRMAHTLMECREASQLLRDYLQSNTDDDDLRDEGSGLYMKLTALEQTALTAMHGGSSKANVNQYDTKIGKLRIETRK